MGRRNRQHTVKISKMENGTLNHEEIICSSLAEAHDIANRHKEHIIHIHDQIKTLVHYEDNIGQNLNIEISTVENSSSEESVLKTTVPEIVTVHEPIVGEEVIETTIEIVTTEEPVMVEKSFETGATEFTVIEEPVFATTVAVSSVEESVIVPKKAAVVKKAVVKKAAVKK